MSSKLKIILEEIRESIRQGRSLRESIGRYPKLFGPMWQNLVEAGEASGQLPATLERLSEYLVARADLQKKAATAAIYPGLLISVCILAIYVFSIKVIPIFTALFKDFGMKLPLVTQIVVVFSSILKDNILETFGGIAVIIFAVRKYSSTESGRKKIDALLFKMPIFGNFILQSAIEKFSSTLGILIHSGIPILQALDIVARTSGNKVIEEALTNAYIDVREGKPLSGSLAKNSIFPPITINMISVGEETGELDKMLEHITNYYREEMQTFVDRLSATLEPVIIVVMGSFVFVLVLALYLPIFEIALLGRGPTR